jgi:hypothetical protein
MSFRFSVGDLMGAANLTCRLSKALRESQNAGEEYRAAIRRTRMCAAFIHSG